MRGALNQAIVARKLNEVPVGAVIVSDSRIISFGYNQNIQTNSVINHAEIVAINNASKFLKNYRLVNCDIYVTLEPCHMCAKAIVDARIKNLYFACPEPKMGSVISVDNFLDNSFLNHKVHYEHGILEKESSQMLKSFFASKRN